MLRTTRVGAPPPPLTRPLAKYAPGNTSPVSGSPTTMKANPEPLTAPLTKFVTSSETVRVVSVPPAPIMDCWDWKVPDMLMIGSNVASKSNSYPPEGAWAKQVFAHRRQATTNQHRFFNTRLIIIMGYKDRGRMSDESATVKRSIEKTGPQGPQVPRIQFWRRTAKTGRLNCAF